MKHRHDWGDIPPMSKQEARRWAMFKWGMVVLFCAIALKVVVDTWA